MTQRWLWATHSALFVLETYGLSVWRGLINTTGFRLNYVQILTLRCENASSFTVFSTYHDSLTLPVLSPWDRLHNICADQYRLILSWLLVVVWHLSQWLDWRRCWYFYLLRGELILRGRVQWPCLLLAEILGFILVDLGWLRCFVELDRVRGDLIRARFRLSGVAWGNIGHYLLIGFLLSNTWEDASLGRRIFVVAELRVIRARLLRIRLHVI